MPRFPVPSNVTLTCPVKGHAFLSRQMPHFYVPSDATLSCPVNCPVLMPHFPVPSNATLSCPVNCPVKCHAFLSRQLSRQMPRFPVPSNATLSCRIPRSLWCLARPVCQVTLSSQWVHREKISVSKLCNNNNTFLKIKKSGSP